MMYIYRTLPKKSLICICILNNIYIIYSQIIVILFFIKNCSFVYKLSNGKLKLNLKLCSNYKYLSKRKKPALKILDFDSV